MERGGGGSQKLVPGLYFLKKIVLVSCYYCKHYNFSVVISHIHARSLIMALLITFDSCVCSGLVVNLEVVDSLLNMKF